MNVRPLIVLGTVAALLTACGGGGGSNNAGQAGSPLVVGVDFTQNESEDLPLDPIVSKSINQMPSLVAIYGTLVTPGPDGQLKPGLAESWKVVDSSHLQVQLRDGLTFQDGTPFDADALKSGIERNRDAGVASFAGVLKQVADVSVEDKQTVNLGFSAPVAGAAVKMLYGRETMIASPTAVEKAGDGFAKNPVGAGPYKVTEVKPLDKVTLERFDGYYDADKYAVKTLVFKNVPPGTQTANALTTGDIDLARVAPNEAEQLSAAPGVTVDSALDPDNIYYFSLCKTDGPLADVRVRQAINFALDRKAITKNMQGDQGAPAWSLFPKGSKFYDAALDESYAYDVKKAKKLLADAGYANGFSMDMNVSPDDSDYMLLAELVQGQLAKVGITVNVKPNPAWIEVLQADATDATVVTSSRSSVEKLERVYLKDSIQNLCNYEDPELTQTISRLAATDQESDAATKDWVKAQDIIFGDALNVYVSFLSQTWASGKNVDGVKIVPLLFGIDYSSVTTG